MATTITTKIARFHSFYRVFERFSRKIFVNKFFVVLLHSVKKSKTIKRYSYGNEENLSALEAQAC
jgi:hypothetical protein